MQEQERAAEPASLGGLSDDEALTVSEVAKRLRMSTDAVYVRINDGRIRAIRDGLTRIPTAALRAYLSQTSAPPAEATAEGAERTDQ